MPKLDPNSREFREAGHRLVDWVADYLDNVDRHDVLARVAPGDVERSLPPSPREDGRPYDALLADFESKILPGITHWNHPAFFAYFSITGSQAGILAEVLIAALNANGMLWKTSPSLTELETVTLRWLREALGLPGNGMTGRNLPPLRVYCSEHAHSSIEKGALALGFGQSGVVQIESDDALRMRPDALEAAIARDRAAGALPCCVVATTGTTSTGSVDPVPAIAAIAQRETMWLHVDSAYAGSSTIVPELRFLWDGVEHADSIVVNPHKWLFTPIDCSVLYTKKPDVLRETFSLIPEYLKTTDTAEV